MPEDYSRGSVLFFHFTWAPNTELKSSGVNGKCITHRAILLPLLLSQWTVIKIILPMSLLWSLRPRDSIMFSKKHPTWKLALQTLRVHDNANGHINEILYDKELQAACYVVGVSQIRHTKKLGPCPLPWIKEFSYLIQMDCPPAEPPGRNTVQLTQ